MRNHLIAALVAALSTFTPLQAARAQITNDASTLALAARIDNNSFDRAQLMIGNQMQFWQPVFDTLLVAEPDGSVSPNMATDYAYNDDNTVLTLILREGITFTDGAVFDAEAVRANLEHLAAGGGQNSFMAAAIEQVEVVSPLEVRLHLSEPDPALLANLGVVGGAMASPASLTAPDAASNPVGSGPYVYDTQQSVAGRAYVYRRNPDYWNAGAFPFDNVTLIPMVDQVARLNALRSGQVDAGLGDARTIAEAAATGLVVNSNDVDWIGLILADRTGAIAAPLADVRVRQAMAMAFDAPSILRYIDMERGRLTNQIFPEVSEAFLPELESVFPYDPAGARALLAEAGYADGFTLTMPELGSMANLNPIVAQMLGDIGITVQWVPIAPNATISELRSGRYPVFFFQFGYQGSWAELRKFAFPTSPWNTSQVNDPALMELVNAAQMATGDEQVAAFQAVNRYLVDNVWFAPWYRRDTIYLSNAQTRVTMHATNVVPHIRNFARAD